MYKKMMEQARKDGVASEKTIWASITAVDGLLAIVAEQHPELYAKFVREQHELLYGSHYNEAMAEEAVKCIMYTDSSGKKHTGAYWTVEEIEDATRGMVFPQGTTKWDKFVAFNVFKSDIGAKVDDATVISLGYSFFFADEDYKGEGKIWQYMTIVS